MCELTCGTILIRPYIFIKHKMIYIFESNFFLNIWNYPEFHIEIEIVNGFKNIKRPQHIEEMCLLCIILFVFLRCIPSFVFLKKILINHIYCFLDMNHKSQYSQSWILFPIWKSANKRFLEKPLQPEDIFSLCWAALSTWCCPKQFNKNKK